MHIPIVYQEEYTNSLALKKIEYVVEETFGEDTTIESVSRTNLHARYFVNADLVIVFGGDGTLLTATHFIKRGVIVGVHTRHEGSLGHFMPLTIETLRAHLEDYRATEAYLSTHFTRYHRLSAKIEKASGTVSPVDLAFNEYAIGNDLFGRPSKYTLKPHLECGPNASEEERKLAREGEFQRSSGVLCSTFQGMTGWVGNVLPSDEFEARMDEYRALLNDGPRQNRQFFFINIHPMSRDYRLNAGFTDRLVIHSNMVGGIIALDGFNEFPFDRNDRLVIEGSDFPLWLLTSPFGANPQASAPSDST